MDWTPLILTFELAATTTFFLCFVAIPLAWWLSSSKSWYRPAIEAVVALPLVLPPTVLGFYLLLLFSPNNSIGQYLSEWLDIQLVFSFPGLVIASMIYSLPFMVQPIQSGLSALPQSIKEASLTLGKSRFQTFLYVLLPNIKSSLLTGVVLAFAHTIGEFGVVLMIGGNIPGVTRVASIAIYDEVESLQYDVANQYSLILLVITFAVLLGIYVLNGSHLKKFR